MGRARGRRGRAVAGRVAGPTSATTPSCSPTATGATSSTPTATGAATPSPPTSPGAAHPFHVAIENFGHDHNIGTVVRTANAFAAAGVHIVGRRRWNRRGAMVTDRYVAVHHHADVDGLAAFAAAHGLVVVAVDNTPGAVRLETAVLPRECVLLFGQEGPGLTDAARAAAGLTVSIAQFGSTRSVNAGVAAGIVMHAWIRAHADLSSAW